MASDSDFVPLPSDHPAHNLLVKRLKKFTGMTVKDADLFFEKLDEMGGCIAGSFVLESIINKTFPRPYRSDIDIWIPHTQSPFSLFGFFKKYNFRRQPRNAKPEYTRMFDQIDGMYIVSPKDSFKNLKHIQIIAVKDKTRGQVVEGFDLTCVQTFFTNGKVYAKDSLLKEIEGEKKTTGVSPVALQSQSYMEWLRTLSRIDKYMHRGFQVDHETWKKIVASINKSIIAKPNFDGDSIFFKFKMLPNQEHFSRIKMQNKYYQYFYKPSAQATSVRAPSTSQPNAGPGRV